ncbi:hypothetical protein MKL09_15175 [Methylobacterium sp. J-048]|uniref:hypothetical protein n=1 Tax=Methylobacterium sp. J-048 TaxID=2836635 RepID=UPI001FBBE7E4|nr:hypothetical protein [Methylobacterium sp. J-048]MCJ2057895.1 hypothetical protein [Methylobacterium sp. J-048]
MVRQDADPGIRRAAERRPPDDFADDIPCETSNLDTQDTNVPGTISMSAALGSHGPRVKWYPDRAGRTLRCLIVSIEADPKIREEFVQSPASRAAAPKLSAFRSTNLNRHCERSEATQCGARSLRVAYP